LYEELLQQPKFWSIYGPYNDIVISTRVRLSRNVSSVAFPVSMDSNEQNFISLIVNKFIQDSVFSSDLTLINLNEIDDDEKRFLRERNLITSEMEKSQKSSVIFNDKNDFVIMVNEEDHFRIQVIKPGLQLMESYKTADMVDNELEKFAAFAFSNELGYISASPANMGTGLKVSAILHLPVLTMRNRISSMNALIKPQNAELKSTLPGSDKMPGSLYQVSSKITLGLSEVDIIETMDGVVGIILQAEDKARDEYLYSSRLSLEDMIGRSFGLLKYSRKMSYVEAMENLSNVRLGIILALIKNHKISLINDLMVNIQWSHLQKNYNKKFRSITEVDEFRADYISRKI